MNMGTLSRVYEEYPPIGSILRSKIYFSTKQYKLKAPRLSILFLKIEMNKIIREPEIANFSNTLIAFILYFIWG